eukprot:2744837-Lingulodinium_polyedra.AAC.1
MPFHDLSPAETALVVERSVERAQVVPADLWPMARSPELGEIFDKVSSLNMARVVSKGMVTLCRHT